MAVMTHERAHGPQRIHWASGVGAGVIAGAVFLVLEMFMVWAFLGQSPWGPPRMIAAMVLGQDVLPPPAAFSLGIVLVAMAIHFTLSILLGLVGAALFSRFAFGGATVVGAIYGFAVYFINFYLIAPAVFPWFTNAQNWVSFIAHVIFGAVMGAAYAWLRARHIAR